MTRHIPVLLEETLGGLHLTNGDTAVDATFGGGGHALEILKSVLPEGRLIGIDADSGALLRFRNEGEPDAFLGPLLEKERIVLIHANYSELETILERLDIPQVDAILADLGFSSDQIGDPTRGFSFMEDGPLDMRLNQETSLRADGSTPLTAERIVNTYSLGELANLLKTYGDETDGKRIAEAIIRTREETPFMTTKALRECVEKAVPRRRGRGQKIHPATKTFQALRIVVNSEYEHLEAFLDQAVQKLKPGGRIGIISFHSGEDRIVKQKFRFHTKGCICPPEFPICQCGKAPLLRILTTKPIEASEREQQKNPRSRSAKLRIAEKV